MKRTLAAAGLFSVFTCLAHAQASPSTQEPDAKPPEVFLDNHRPLIQKKDKAPTARTVSGIVTDDTGRPLEGALVSVREVKTSETRKFFTKKDGRYSFDDLAFTEDYEVQAKWKKLISEPRKISQYDHTAKVVRLLQVTTPEGYTAPTAAAEVKKQDPPKNNP
jgi:hypothetical protein